MLKVKLAGEQNNLLTDGSPSPEAADTPNDQLLMF